MEYLPPELSDSYTPCEPQGGVSFEPQHLGTVIINGTNSLRVFPDSPREATSQA
jgi:hypothetical protein